MGLDVVHLPFPGLYADDMSLLGNDAASLKCGLSVVVYRVEWGAKSNTKKSGTFRAIHQETPTACLN